MDAPQEIAEELREREPVFHREPPGSGREHFEALLTRDFFEVGGSGRVYERERVIETAVDRYERDDPGVLNDVTDFEVRELSEHVYLTTYTLGQPDGFDTRVTRRSTIWTNASGQWQIAYHQGTVVAP